MAVINLDPANDRLPYECAVNIEDLIKLEDAMGLALMVVILPSFKLPLTSLFSYTKCHLFLYVNLCILSICSGLVYCMDYLEKNLDWLKAKLEPLEKGMKVQFSNVNFLPVYKCIITLN